MGALVSLPLSCCAACAGQCCASAACSCIQCACVVPQKIAVTVYFLILFMFTIFALCTLYWGGDVVIGGTTKPQPEGTSGYSVEDLKKYFSERAVSTAQHDYNEHFWCAERYTGGWVICCEDVCGGIYSVYRWSFVLFIFFGSMALFTSCKTVCGSRLNRGFWFLKVLVLLGLAISTLFISNDILSVYREVARYISVLFLLLMIVFYIDWAYSTNNWLADKDSDCEDNRWKVAVLATSTVLYAVSLTGIILMFQHYTDCTSGINKAFIVITLVVTFVVTIISLSWIAPHGALITSATVTTYAVFLCYSGVSSNPTCSSTTGNGVSQLVVGIIVAAGSLVSSAYSAANQKDHFLSPDEEDASEAYRDVESSEQAEKEEVGAGSSGSLHLVLVISSMYMAMLLSGWSILLPADNAALHSSGELQSYSKGWGSFWVQFGSQWACLLLYTWTLVAPRLFPDRDFGVELD